MKSITLFVLLAISTSLYSQQNNPGIQTDYLKKSKHQKTAAWVLAGVGFLSTVVYSARTNTRDDGWGPVEGSKNDGIFLATSIAAFGGSAILFIAGARNKKKSMSLSFKNEPMQQLQKNSFTFRHIPSLSVKFNL